MMTESENILEFIDGSLDPDAEQQLFDAMARQPELRTTLRQFIQISEGVRSDREAFAPPAHVERALLAGLGLAPIAGAIVSETAGAGWLARLATLGSRFWPMVASFVTGAILAGGGTYLATHSDNQAVSVVQQNGAVQERTVDAPVPAAIPAPVTGMASAPVQSVTPAETPVAAVQPSRSVAERRGNVAYSIREAAPTRATSQTTTRDQQTSATSTTSNVPSVVAPDSATRMSADISRPALQEVAAPQPDIQGIIEEDGDALRRQSPPSGVTTIPGSIADEVKPARGLFEIRTQKAMTVQFISNNAQSHEQPLLEDLFEDMAFGVYVTIAPSFMVGAEGGVERYAQTLAVYRGDTALIEQMPSYTWIGASARYDFGALPVLDVHPFAQLTGGLNSAGGLVRLRGGLNIPLKQGVTPIISIAGETSSLIYHFNGQPQLAGRWGLTAGVGLQF